LGFDLVSEEMRRLAGGVCDQRLGLRQLQLELLAQERRDPRLDLLGLVLGTGKPQQPVVAVPDITKPPVARTLLCVVKSDWMIVSEVRPGRL
jgi:hypothetical protein